MKAWLLFLVMVIVGVSGCATATVTSGGGPDMQSAQGEAYNGPKARIAVADFEDKMSSSGYYRAEYGRGMSDMLTNALFQSNRYIVLEREKLQAVLAEQNLGASGRVKKDTAAAIGEIEGAELLVTAAITGFDPGTSGGGGGVGGLMGGMLGGVTGAFKKASVAMDLRVIDSRTSRIIASTSVEGTATAVGGGVGLIGGSMGGALGGFAKTPMETAIRKMIQAAVDFIVSRTPQSYYHYSATGEPMAVGKRGGSGAEMGTSHASAMTESPQDEMGTPKAKKTIQSIRTDFDKNLIAHLNEVKRRGSVLSVVVSFSFEGKKESQFVSVEKSRSHVMDYDSGETYPMVTVDGFHSGRITPGEVKTLQATFKAPKNAKSVGITISGVGTFEDVNLGK
jgi:curli biogenesis system outer membrane secretion channel CsgG